MRNLIGFDEAREIVGFGRFPYAQAWLDRGIAHPATLGGPEVTEV